MIKENALNFQSFDYENETYYIPKINDVKTVLKNINEYIKSTEDCYFAVCNDKECCVCLDKDSCKKINCKNCLLDVDSYEKYEALKEFFKENSIKLPNLTESSPIDNKTISDAITCLSDILSYQKDEKKFKLIKIRKELNN